MYSYIQHRDPRAIPFRRRPRKEPEPNRGAVLFSPPPSPRHHAAAVADDASASSGCWDYETATSSDWYNASSADLESDPEPCQARVDDPASGRDDESSAGSDRADSEEGGNHAGYAAEPPPHNADSPVRDGGVADGTAAAAATASSLPDEVAYHRRFGPQIEAWLSDVERRASQNTNVYLRDGVTLNPARAPYISLQGGGSGSGWDASGSDQTFWKWSILLQRWIHVDDATGMLLIYPKQLMR